ncbi:tetratricopeptide repeat protein [Sandarakinorhabdus sp. AAP62]|uniref:tetratricopeptide repeat protein n=1 Tax=Sandarakinorhabdus sp. AAP62 TaxID=1248916 RepID=UPI000365165F|nr:tetratricopeptide repeat protein [Sandarakinorhabdus sp. AAP62]
MRRVLILLCLLAGPLRAQEATGEAALAAPCREAAEAARPSGSQLSRCDRAIRQPGVPAPVRLAMLMNRGIALLRAGKLARAEADFDLAIRSAPGLAEAWINKGVVLARQPGRETEAVALISHGIEIGPKEPARAYFARAQALEVAGKLREAMDDYAAAARADPDWPAPAEELKRFRVERRKVLRG